MVLIFTLCMFFGFLRAVSGCTPPDPFPGDLPREGGSASTSTSTTSSGGTGGSTLIDCASPDAKACGNGICVDKNLPQNGCEEASCSPCFEGMDLPHASPGCAPNGDCTAVCQGGYGDCNLNGLDGCEILLLTDPKNCGACGNVCPNACSQGNCQ